MMYRLAVDNGQKNPIDWAPEKGEIDGFRAAAGEAVALADLEGREVAIILHQEWWEDGVDLKAEAVVKIAKV